jgi:hypothetical protein
MSSKAKSSAGDDALAKALKALTARKMDVAAFWLKKWSAGNAGNQAALRTSAEKAWRIIPPCWICPLWRNCASVWKNPITL